MEASFSYFIVKSSTILQYQQMYLLQYRNNELCVL